MTNQETKAFKRYKRVKHGVNSLVENMEEYIMYVTIYDYPDEDPQKLRAHIQKLKEITTALKTEMQLKQIKPKKYKND